MTCGVSDYLEINSKFHRDLEMIINEGMKYFNKSYFLSVKNNGGTIRIEDGNYNLFKELPSFHDADYSLYFIRDDYGAYYVCTVLFPEEY